MMMNNFTCVKKCKRTNFLRIIEHFDRLIQQVADHLQITIYKTCVVIITGWDLQQISTTCE